MFDVVVVVIFFFVVGFVLRFDFFVLFCFFSFSTF